MAVASKRRGIFYGWWLLGAGTIVLVMQGGLYAYGFPLFFVPLAATLGTSRGALSLAFSFTRLESSLLGPIEGYLIDRFGPRGIMYVGFGLLGVSFILFSMVNSLLAFYMVFPIVALGASLSGFLPVITAVNNWFSRRRGLATGICSSGVNIGGALLFLMAICISIYGWRPTAALTGVLILALGFPLTAMMRHRPQPYGYLPDGDEAEEAGDSEDGASSRAQETPDFTPKQALKTPRILDHRFRSRVLAVHRGDGVHSPGAASGRPRHVIRCRGLRAVVHDGRGNGRARVRRLPGRPLRLQAGTLGELPVSVPGRGGALHGAYHDSGPWSMP